jgi:hypothetical protein
MAVSLSANVRNRRRGRGNQTVQERQLATRLSRSRRVLRTAGVGQGPTKNPIVCLASHSRHWGLNIFDDFFGPNRFNGLVVAEVRCKKKSNAPVTGDRSEHGGWFRRPRPTLSARHPPELFPILAHDRGSRFQPDADATTRIDIGTLGGNAPDDILGGQYSWHRSPP